MIELLETWKKRLERFEKNSNVAKGMSSEAAMAVQHARVLTLKDCIKELQAVIDPSTQMIDKVFKIKPPEWSTVGCVANRHFKTPFGWVGLRLDYYTAGIPAWVVTGINKHLEWKDLETFKTEQEAEDFAIEFYEEQVKKWLIEIT